MRIINDRVDGAKRSPFARMLSKLHRHSGLGNAGAPRKFPLPRILDGLRRHFALGNADVVRIIRFGGLGEKVWAIESALDHGEEVSTPFRDVELISRDEQEYIDEALRIHARVIFGIADSSFMFLQSEDKSAERLVSRYFQDVEEAPDQSFG